MNQNFSIANYYYRDFEDLSAYVSWKDLRVYGLIFSGVCFVCLFVALIGEISKADLSLRIFSSVLASEVLFLGFWVWTLMLRDQRVLDRFNKKYSLSQGSLNNIKSKRLSEILNCPPQDFFNEAKAFDEMLALSERYRGPFELTAERFSQWIYSPDSKARLMTLLVLLASSVIVLSVRDNADLRSVFHFYGSAGLDYIGVVYFFATLLISIFLAAASVIFKAFIYILHVISWRLDGKKSSSPHIVRYIINDLVRYYQRPLIKCKVAR